MRTIEEFETSRIARILDGLLIVGDYFKSCYNKYIEHRQKQADRILAMYVKNHADAERYLDVVKNNNLYLLK